MVTRRPTLLGRRIIVVLLLWCSLTRTVLCASSLAPVAVGSRGNCEVNLDAVIALAKRYIPPELVDQNLQFEPLSCTGKNDGDVFQYEQGDKNDRKTVMIRGTSTSALTSGLGWYLKYEAKKHLSWTGDNLNFTDMTQLPMPPTKVQKRRQGKFSYYQNVCTVSYSMAWWDLKRWQRELDWMALAGINFPLAFTGQEIVWLNVFRQLGVSDEAILRFLGGPAFMAWQRMGNIQEWGGPMPMEWIERQYKLQLGILKHARELGRIPVLPAFAGFVPVEMKTLYPNANIGLSSKWLGFNTTYTPVHLVEVTDPLFQTIGELFLKKLTELYGTDHYYNADTFNEMDPSSGDLEYLTAAGKAVSSSIQAVDPDGVWVMQGWLFCNARFWTTERIAAYLSSVPNDGMVILDLQSETSPQYPRTDSYFGKPFIYSMLHNFGGNHGMYGRMQTISADPPGLFRNSSSTIVGVGLTMEGINQNFIVYDLMTEMAWRAEPPDLEEWVQAYAFRRYGGSSVLTDMAWLQLLNTVYTCRSKQSRSVTKSLAVKRPGFDLMHRGFMPTELFYEPEDLVVAWSYLLKAYSGTIYTQTYRYDLVDLTRQVLSNLLIPTYRQVLEAFELRQRFAFQVYSKRFLEMLDDMDRIVSSSESFLLENWLASARSCAGNNTAVAALYEFNARNQITLWGPNGEINDYASKQFGGLISGYYRPRWELFMGQLSDGIQSGAEFDEDKFNSECLKLEQAWQHSQQHYPSQPSGDSYEIAIELYGKYKALLLPADIYTF